MRLDTESDTLFPSNTLFPAGELLSHGRPELQSSRCHLSIWAPVSFPAEWGLLCPPHREAVEFRRMGEYFVKHRFLLNVGTLSWVHVPAHSVFLDVWPVGK